MRRRIFYITFILFSLILLHSRIFAQVQWSKFVGNPVLDKGPAFFDISAIGQPTVIIEDDTIKMWYAGVGEDYKSRICYAYSTDGIHWVKHPSPVLDLGDPGEWDCGWLDTPGIVRGVDGYMLYYYGDTVQQSPAISSALGLAVSNDGIHWDKYHGNPVFERGDPGAWDCNWVESPTVIFDSIAGEFRMWYSGMDTSNWKSPVGLATSPDGIVWTRYSGNPVISPGNWGAYDDMWAGTPVVILYDNLYEMWYSATRASSYNYQTGEFDTISICYATSADGMNWNKYPGNPLFNTYTSPYDSLLDKGGPWAPGVVYNKVDEQYSMFYETKGSNSNFRISLATAPRTITGISREPHPEYSICVFPNPFRHEARITFNGILVNASLIVYNAYGKPVFERNGLNGKEIRFSGSQLPDGLYICRIFNGPEVLTGKLLVF